MAKKQNLIQFNKSHINVAIKWQIEIIASLADIVDMLPPETIDKSSLVLSILYRCYENAPEVQKD